MSDENKATRPGTPETPQKQTREPTFVSRKTITREEELEKIPTVINQIQKQTKLQR